MQSEIIEYQRYFNVELFEYRSIYLYNISSKYQNKHSNKSTLFFREIVCFINISKL